MPAISAIRSSPRSATLARRADADVLGVRYLVKISKTPWRSPKGSISVIPFEKPERTWRDYWDVNEGVRAMLLLGDPEIPSNYEDDEL
jgi:hypothetical protein